MAKVPCVAGNTCERDGRRGWGVCVVRLESRDRRRERQKTPSIFGPDSSE